MKLNLDIRDLKEGRYVIFILNTQISCKTVEYADSHAQAMKILNEYEQEGCICIITRVLNNTLTIKDKRSYND